MNGKGPCRLVHIRLWKMVDISDLQNSTIHVREQWQVCQADQKRNWTLRLNKPLYEKPENAPCIASAFSIYSLYDFLLN